MARARFQRFTTTERKAALRRYRKAREAGKSHTAAARAAAIDPRIIERWLDDENAAPVAVVVKQKPCLGGCGKTIKSTHAGHRLCPSCGTALGKLPRAWSA